VILSNLDIHTALDKRHLVITPEPAPRAGIAPAARCPYQTSSVDLRLGDEITWFKPDIGFQIDLRRGGFADLFGPNSKRIKITQDQPYTLNHGKLVLARTLEEIELPIHSTARCLAARVEGKSSYARCGLLVHFTAPTIHAGFKGTITLELINLGPYPILLYPGMPICQLIVEQVSGRPARNDSQFQGQIRAGGEKA
jgi:dCTP deaminase